MSEARPRLVCLLPVRNAEDDIADWFRPVERFADAVVALDDGSTDGTRAILEHEPLVHTLLENPRRESYSGWDDAGNRQRLLDAAAEAEPDWVLSLDADERIDAEDADALVRFIATDAIPFCAYGLQNYRVWGGDRFDPRPTCVYRLFPFRPGQRFPRQRLHFNPIPAEIPRSAWVPTSLRIRHLGARSPERLEQRLAKYRQADPDREWPTDFGDLSRPPAGDLPRWPKRPADLPVLRPPAPDGAPGRKPRIAVLLPVRNAEADLDAWFRSVERFADVVVALDDGSTDATRAILEREPLVKALLHNPRRETYAGWDDAGNRQRLLDAAQAVDPDWILSLDADERLDASDADALERLVRDGAARDAAYGFRVLRMIEDGECYDHDSLYVYRLFAYAPDQRFPTDRLHFVPVPTSIDRRRFVRTALRIQHFGSATATRRRARFEKYRQADPGLDWQSDYGHLVAEPAQLRRFEALAPDAVLLPDAGLTPGAIADEFDADAPTLSAIVISRNDEDRIEGVVRAVVEQECPEPFEVIVVTSGTDRTAAIVREQFPDVKLVALSDPALPGAARNAGLRVARGEFVSFPGSHVVLPPGSLAARLRAHRLGHAMVTGTTLNGTPTRAGWANYFLDHSTVLPGRPSGRLAGPPAHCSYIRDHLVRIGGFPEDMRAGEDTVVNVDLHRRGLRAYRAQDLHLTHRSRASTPLRLVRHHFQRGRGMGRILLAEHRDRGGLLRRAARPFGTEYLQRRLSSIATNVEHWGDGLHREYRAARPLVAAGAVGALVGIWAEILRPARGKTRVLLGRPGDQRAPRRASVHERHRGEIAVNAFALPAGERAVAGVAEGTGRLTYLSPFAWRVRRDGTLEGPDDTALLDEAAAAGAAPLMVVTNLRGDGFDPELGAAVIDDADARQRMLAGIDRVIEERGYRGAVLDFERLPPESRDPYSALVRELGARLRPRGLPLAVAVAPRYSRHDEGEWSAAHDHVAIGAAADMLIVMAYQWVSDESGPRAPAPLPEISAVIRHTLDGVPAERVMLGVPLYGYDWTLEGGRVTHRRTVFSDDALALAARHGARVEYDEPLEAASFRYALDGRDHVVWFEDDRSLRAKLDLVRALGLAGISLWRLPCAYEPIWTLVDDLFEVRPPAEPAEAVAAALAA